MHGQGTPEQGLAGILLLERGQSSDQEGLPGGKGVDSVYTQGSGGWRHHPQSTHLAYCFGNHKPNFVTKALERRT